LQTVAYNSATPPQSYQSSKTSASEVTKFEQQLLQSNANIFSKFQNVFIFVL
jgi:hypothetical protein